MGDAQSAQREGKKDEAAAEEESGKVDDAQAEHSTGDKPLKNIVQISEINEKAGISIAGVNGHCEDEVATDAVLSQDGDILETEIPLEEEEEEEQAPKHVERNEKESSNGVDVAQDVPLDMIEIDAKKNDINDGFRKFFSNIGLRLSIKRGSSDLLRESPDETNREEPTGTNREEPGAEEPLDVVVNEPTCESAEQNTDVNTAQVTNDNDSTTCPTLTDISPEEVVENAEEKATEAKEDGESDNADPPITSPAEEEQHQEATPEEELQTTSGQEEVVSPIKKFFTTGIFSGLRKKRRPAEEETNEKEMVDMGTKGAVEVLEESEQIQQLDKVQIDPGIEAAVVDTEDKENELQQEVLSPTSTETTDEGKPPVEDLSTHEALDNQEKEKVPSSPLRRLLSGSSFKKLSKRPRSRRSSESRLSDSGEQAADQLMSSTESAENHKEDGSTQPSSEVPEEEDSAWTSFKKLLTPKKRRRTPSLSNKEADIQATAEKPKQSEGEHISDRSTEEDRKRKDSSVSWEAVLCGSGKKRSRKTSDSEDETPQVDNDNKQDPTSKHGVESPHESSNERKNGTLVSSPRVHRTESDGQSTWITFKRLVTPKRKAKDEDESKDVVQSDGELSQDESSFSIKKLLPGRKKRRSPEKQDQVSSDEADKDVPSGDEDSETPAVVPLSEFDIPESVVQIQTQVDIESRILEESDHKIPQDLLQHTPEPALPCDGPQNEAKDAENLAATNPAKTEDEEEVSELVSKHQQLSDITEEGIITETIPTPASANDEAGKDDTIAEDLIEITSEAFTAPEPASVTTLADETEMISAVSQLSTESSKTSGNTTPVPAEYEVMETDALLHQVVENISEAPKAVPICSTTPKSESIVGSVLHQIFRSFVKEESASAAPVYGEDVLDESSEVDAQMQMVFTEPQSEAQRETEKVHESETEAAKLNLEDSEYPSQQEGISAEIITEKPKETEEIFTEASDEPENIETQLDAFKDEHVQEPEVLEVVPATPTLEDGSAPSLELEVKPEDASVAETVTDELKEETLPLADDSFELLYASTSEYVEEPEVVDTAQASSDSKVDNLLSPEEVKPEGMLELEKATDEPKQEPEEGVQPDDNLLDKAEETADDQEPEVLPSNVEEAGMEAKTEEDIFTDKHEIPESVDGGITPIPLSEDTLEQVDTPETEGIQEQELQTLQPLDRIEQEETLQVGEVVSGYVEEPPSLDTGDTAKDIPAEEDASIDVPAGTESVEGGTETVPLTQGSLESMDLLTNEQVKEPEDLQTGQASPFIIGETQQEMEEPQQNLQVADVRTENVQEPQVLPSVVKDAVGETLIVMEERTPMPEVTESFEEIDATTPLAESLEPVDLPTSEQIHVQEKIFEDIHEVEAVTDGPQEETEFKGDAQEKPQGETVQENLCVEGATTDVPVVTESIEGGSATLPLTELGTEPVKDLKAEDGQGPDKIQGSPLAFKGDGLLPLERVISEGITVEETVTEESMEETKVTVEQQEKIQVEDIDSENVQEPEVLQSVVEDAVKEALMEEGTSVPMPEVKDGIDLESARTPVIEGSPEPMISTTEQVQVPDVKTAEASPSDSAANLLEKPVTEEPHPATEVKVEDLKTENIQEQEEPPSYVKDVQETSTEGGVIQASVVSESITEGSGMVPPTELSPELKDVKRTEDEQEPEVTDTAQGVKSVPEISSLSPLEKAVSEDVPTLETVIDEPQKDTEMIVEQEEKMEGVTTEYVKEPEEPALPLTEQSPESVDISKTEELHETEVLNTEQESPIDSDEANLPELDEASSVDAHMDQIQEQEEIETVQKSLDKEISEDIPVVETVVEEPQKDTEVNAQEKLQAEADTTENSQEPEVLLPTVKEIIQETSIEKTVLVSEVAEGIDEGKETTLLSEQGPEPVDISKTENVQEPDIKQEPPLDLEKDNLLHEKVISEGIPAVQTIIDEPQKETDVHGEPQDKGQTEASEPEHVLKTEVLPSDVEDTVTDTRAEDDASTDVHVVAESTELGGAETQVTEELPSDKEDNVKDVKTEEGISMPKDGSAEKLESHILPEHVTRKETDSAISSVTDQIESEVTAQLDQVEEVLEGHKPEKMLQDVKFEQEDLTLEVAQELETIPQLHVSFEESNNVQVPGETLLCEITQAPAVDNAAITDESKHELHLSEVQVTDEREKEGEHPSSETKAATLEHAVVAEVVTCHLKEVVATIPDVLTEKMTVITKPPINGGANQEVFEKANTVVPLERDDSAVTAEQFSGAQMMHVPSGAFEDYHKIEVLEVEVTETMEVINVCHETVTKVENLSTTHDIEEETKATIQEIIQHVPDIFPETASESEVAILKHAVTKLQDTVSEVCELAEPESTQTENQKEVDDGTESKGEVPALISDDSATAQQVSPKLEETKAEEMKTAAGEDIKSLSEEIDVRKGHEPPQITQISHSLVATPSNTGFVIPQNTGIVSSVGNVESPSSLSLEFKLNIHFGQAKAQPPMTTTDRTEPLKKKDVSEVGVQAEKAAKPSEPTVPTHQAQGQESTEITTQPVQLDVSIQTIKTAESDTKPPASLSAITEGPEPVKEVDVSEVGVQEQTEMSEVNYQSTEISESVALQVSSAGEVIKSQPELLDLAIHADEAKELVSKESVPPPPVEEKDESVEQVDVPNAGVDVVEPIEPVKPIHLTQTADRHVEFAQAITDILPADITILATGPEVLDVEAETPVAERESSPQPKEKEVEQLTQTDVSEVEDKAKDAVEPAEPIHFTQRAESKIEPTEVTVHPTESEESIADSYKEERAVIMTQPVLLDVAIHAIETIEVQSKAVSSPPPIIEKAEDLTLPDVSRDEVQEPVELITSTENAEGQKQIELPEVGDQAAKIEEPEEPSGLTERAAMTTHPGLLDVGSHIETEEPMTKAPASPPPTTEKSEDLMLGNVSEVEGNAKEAAEPVESIDLTQRAESKIEPIEINVHPTEMEDSVAHIDSTEKAVIMTHPFLLDLAVHATKTVEVESKAPASPPPITERTEALTPLDVSNDEVQAVEPVEPAAQITPTESHTQIEPPEADDQATEITEPEEPLSEEKPVIPTQQVSLESDIRTTEMVDQVANAPTVSVDIMAPLKQADVSDPDAQAEEASEGQKQSELIETCLEATGITEPEVSFDLTEKAVITTHPAQLDDGVHTTKTVEVEDVEEEKAEMVERVTSSVQSTDNIQEEVLLSGPVESEADDQETKVEKKHAHHPEEENDQDVWMDAEEGLSTQEETEVSFQEVEEHLDSKAESVQGEEAALEEEVEITPNVQTEEEGSQQEVYETKEACGNESEGEGEDFAIALEHQEFAAGSVTTVEWD
ncbi:A-kinase anchor protein 12 [Xyrichtys novacula]|uniref:A-kinase anchor protein 12 n=1 Tax=Xyrichtys novacula TaxID=13765 RepID=A0AAV1GLX1_XYRNO|nr:A-kinase anchor protein 12 [Xyrichtys novacula]